MSLIGDLTLDEINRSIYTRYGIDFSEYERDSLRRRVSRFMRKYGIKNPLALWQAMLQEPDFIHTYIDELTVGHTELFRNPGFWVRLAEVLTIAAAKETLNRPFVVWHAGCSTGEEVFSLAILLKQLDLLADAKLMATDLNRHFIAPAQKGYIAKEALENAFQHYRKINNTTEALTNYFEAPSGESGYYLKAELLQHITFKVQNLIREQPEAPMDLIMCRNVLIYFDAPLKERLVQRFYECLAPRGWLVLGYYESIPLPLKEKFEVIDQKEKLYRKLG